jgi:hypothetical protein
MAGFIVAIYLLGMFVAIPLFGIAYMKSHGAGWSISILIAVLSVMFCYGLFSHVLDMGLYQGIIFQRWVG